MIYSVNFGNKKLFLQLSDSLFFAISEGVKMLFRVRGHGSTDLYSVTLNAIFDSVIPAEVIRSGV